MPLRSYFAPIRSFEAAEMSAWPITKGYAIKGLCLKTICPKGICLMTVCLKGTMPYDSVPQRDYAL